MPAKLQAVALQTINSNIVHDSLKYNQIRALVNGICLNRKLKKNAT